MNALVLLSAAMFGADPQADARAALATIERIWHPRSLSTVPPITPPSYPPIIKESRSGGSALEDDEDPFAPENKREQEPKRRLLEVKSAPSLSRPVPLVHRETTIVRTFVTPRAVAPPARRFISAPPVMLATRSMGVRMMSSRSSGGCAT